MAQLLAAMLKKFEQLNNNGIIGETALIEAAATEFKTIIDLVRAALVNKLFPGQRERWVNLQALYADRVVVSAEMGRLYSYPYTISDSNVVELGEPVEVIRDYTPVVSAIGMALKEALANSPKKDNGCFIEAKDKKGLKYRIKVIQSGLSDNNNFYPDKVLKDAVPLIEGVRVFAKSDEEHIYARGKSFDNLIGQLTHVEFVEGKGADAGAVYADLELLESAGEVTTKMLEAYNRGMANLFGFSIDATGPATRGAGNRITAKSITKVNSVDLIIEPGAGGEIVNLIEAKQTPEGDTDMKLRQRMIEAIKAANKGVLPDGLNTEDDDALDAAFREAVAPGSIETKVDATPQPGVVTQKELEETVRMVEARADMRVTIAGCGLPQQAKEKLTAEFIAMESFTEAQVAERIQAEADYLAKFTEAGNVAGMNTGRVEMGEGRAEKVASMLDDFFDPDNRDVISFKECYINITGDKRVTGHLKDCDVVRMRESLAGSDVAFVEAINTTGFANALGNALTRRMLANYALPSPYDAWRELANIVPVNDFRTQERNRVGGYGDLPVVAEDGAYNALTTPTDEVASYAVTKRGGVETVSLEAVKNDDVGLIQRLPMQLSTAAKRTLSKFVFDFFATNGLIYDGVAFFAAAHNNLGAAALSAPALAAGRLAMLKQTEKDSGERLGIGPRNLLVSADNEEVAVDLFRRNTENDRNFTQSLSLNVIPVWYWTDPNDWVLTADRNEAPCIELGFLDGNEEPELFVQDNPTQGSLFSNDQLRYKIRHIYSGVVTDFRPAYKGVVV